MATDQLTDLTRPAVDVVDLPIEGMTCAACANRIERKLNKLDGVEATVNFATESARVHAPAGLGRDELVAQVRAAGYDVRPEPAPAATAGPGDHGADDGGGHHHEELDDADLRTR
ncbi:MAG: heavy-metal-associated domain-containing protein, partial [Acidimicrobiales bacterium]|nr:heavy-metal-associated domain-containing protein [Acidimicrobiales bacterium]